MSKIRVAYWRVLALFVVLITAVGTISAFETPKAEAAIASQFNPGYIISDQNFFDGNSMSPMDVQYFLNSKLASCRSGYVCLKDYLQSVPNLPAEAGLCAGYTAHPWQSAAEIISRIGQSCGVNPKALLVLLEKEQSLVTYSAPSGTRYSSATGFGCPDTAPCDPTVAGFFYQVYFAARQLRNYGLNPSRWNYQAGRVNDILYHPNRDCGSSGVYISNRATAALYNYTPYQPNAAALANLYGTGDGCSAYGNRNFWRIYTDWFGPTTAPVGTPEGEVTLSGTPAGLSITGWAVDPDATSVQLPIAVQIGTVWRGTTANVAGADRSASYPGAGPNHDINAVLPIEAGTYTVCVYLVNGGGAGGMGTTGCQTVIIPKAAEPVGTIETITATPGNISLSGWAVLPDTPSAAVNLAANIGSRWIQLTSSLPNTTAPNRVSNAGQNQGFSGSFPADSGPQTVCVWASKSNGGAVNLGCRLVTVPAPRATQAVIESTAVSGNVVTINGWAVWPDSPSTTVRLAANYDGIWIPIDANATNPAANAAVPGVGNQHGFSIPITMPSGTRSLCIWTLNPAGPPSNIGCRTVAVGVAPPASMYAVETLSGGARTINYSGWGVWTQQPSATVRFALNVGSQWIPIDANQPNNAAQIAVPGIGANHGFSGSTPFAPGTYSACLWMAEPNAPAKAVDCRTITVVNGQETVGELVGLSGGVGGIHVDGWAVKPDQPGATVRLAANIGSSWYPIDTGVANSVAGTRVSGAGANQGFAALVPAPVGTSDVCIWVESASGPYKLSCGTVTVEPTPDISSSITEAVGVAGGVRISGWAVWPGSPQTTVNVAASFGNQWTAMNRPLPNSSAPTYVNGAGPYQGFSGVVATPSGQQTVCLWGSRPSGPAALFGCKTVTVP